MLFHVQEHHFTIPGIAAALQELDLEFLDFDVDPATRHVYQALFGGRPELEYWQALEKLYPEDLPGDVSVLVPRAKRAVGLKHGVARWVIIRVRRP